LRALYIRGGFLNPLENMTPEERFHEAFIWGLKMEHRAEDLEREVERLSAGIIRRYGSEK